MSGEFNHGLRVIIDRINAFPADFEERAGFIPNKWVRALNFTKDAMQRNIFTDAEVLAFREAIFKLDRLTYSAMIMDTLEDDTVGKNVPARERDVGKVRGTLHNPTYAPTFLPKEQLQELLAHKESLLVNKLSPWTKI